MNRMKEVAEKHVSLQIKAEDYPKVGKALIKAIGSVYNLTEEETNLLLESYKKLSGLFIEIESNRYNQIQESGGWEDYKEFIIAEKTLTNIQGDTISLTLKTVNGEKVLPHKPEQYITMQVNGVQRHFTITDSGEDYYKLLIKVKEVTDNNSFSVTQYLRDAEMNTIVELRPPCGIPFKLDNVIPLVLISGGSGESNSIAVMQAIKESIKNGQSDKLPSSIHIIHSTQGENSDTHQLDLPVEQLRDLGLKVSYDKYYTQDSYSKNNTIHIGRINEKSLNSILDNHNNNYEICASLSFSANLQQILKGWGVAEDNIHIDGFGPSQEVFDSYLIGQDNPGSSVCSFAHE